MWTMHLGESASEMCELVDCWEVLAFHRDGTLDAVRICCWLVHDLGRGDTPCV